MKKYLKLAKKYYRQKADILVCYKDLLAIGAKILVFIIAITLILNLFTSNANAGQVKKATQVKTAKSSAVYYLDHKRGLKKAYTCANSFLSYGNKWKDVKIISEQELNSYSEVNLIKTAKNPGVYYIYNAKKALISSESEFIKLGFDWQDIITVSQVDFDSYIETGLNGLIGVVADSTQINTVSNSSNNSNSSNSNSGPVYISLDKESPKDGYMIINSKDNLMASYNLVSKVKAVKITSLSFSFTGGYSTDLIKGVYLTNEAGTKYQVTPNWDGRKAVFNFGNEGLVIAANETKKIKIYCDMAGSKSNLGQSYQVSVAGADFIKADANFGGSFPILSGRFGVLVADDVMGKISVSETSLEGYQSQVIIGSTEQVMAKFSVAEISKHEDIAIKKVTIKNRGTATYAMVENFKLKDERGKTVAQVKAADVNYGVTFNLSDYIIAKSSKAVFTVVADIKEGEGKTCDYDVMDITGVGRVTNVSLTSKITIVEETIFIKRETIGVSSKDLKTNNKVFSSQRGVIVGNFEIKNNNKIVTLQSLDVELIKNSDAPDLDSTVYLINYDTGEVYGAVDGRKLTGGTAISMIAVTLQKKKSVTVSLVTDIPRDTISGDFYQIRLNKIHYTAENGAYYADTIGLLGIKLSLTKSNLFAYPDYDVQGLTYIVGEDGVTVANFVLEAAAGEDITINGLTVATGDTSGGITYDNGFSALRAYINGKQVGQVIYQPFGGVFEFSGFNYRLKNGSRVDVVVAADTVRDLRVSQTQMILTQITATGYSSGIPTTVSGLVTPSFPVFFDVTELEMAVDKGTGIIFDTSNNFAMTLKIANTGIEEIRLKDITLVTSNDGFTSSLGFFNLEVYDRDMDRRISNISRPIAGANVLSLGNIIIKPGEIIYFDIYVDTDAGVPPMAFNAYFMDLNAQGQTSKLIPDIYGDPSNPVEIIVQ